MVGGGHVRLYIQHIVQSLGELGREPGISVRDNLLVLRLHEPYA
jgi:hypothetical protein